MAGVLCSMVGASFSAAASPTVTLNAIQLDETTSPAGQGYGVSGISPGANPTGVTISLYFNPAFVTRDCVYGLFNGSVPSLAIFVETTGQIRWYFKAVSGGSHDLRTNTGVLTQNVWNHIMFSADFVNQVTHCYVNNVSTGFASTSWISGQLPLWNATSTMSIGRSEGTGAIVGYDVSGKTTQIWINNSYTDLSNSTNRDKFWDSTNSRGYNLGTTGTKTGLSQPLIYHYGNTSTFPTNNGTLSYTFGTTTPLNYVAPTDATGPVVTD